MAQSRLYNEVLVCYDITDTRQRNKLFKELKDISLTAIQKSVFWGYLNRAEEESVRRLLRTYCAKTDKAFIAQVHLAAQIAAQNGVGYSKADFPPKTPEYHVL